MKASPHDKNLPLPMKISAAGLAGCTADLVTFPLDTIKVWLQVRGESPVTTKLSDKNVEAIPLRNPSSQNIGVSTVKKVAANARNSSHSVSNVTLRAAYMCHNATSISSKTTKFTNSASQIILNKLKCGGVRSMYSGLNAGLQRQIGFCSVRIGFYDNVKKFFSDLFPGTPGSKMFGQRILAGATTGCMAVCLFQPTEVVKIQMQAASGRYKGAFHAYRHLFNLGGVAEMWKGIEANCIRTAVVNVCELVTYDIVKESLLKRNLMEDKLPCHFTSALISGLITTVVASPVDVVKTRFMNSEKGNYKNPIQCAMHMFKSEGFKAFYKGFVPSYIRLGSWNIAMFVSYEQYKRLFGGNIFTGVGSTTTQIVQQTQTPDPVYPAHVAALSHSINGAGRIS